MNKKTKIYLIIILLLLIGIRFIIIPIYNTKNKYEKKYISLNNKLSEIENNFNKYYQIKNNINLLNKTHSFFSAKSSFVSFIETTLNKLDLMNKLDNTLKSNFEINDSLKLDNNIKLYSIYLKFNLIDLDKIISLLDDFIKSKYYIKIDSFKIEKKADNSFNFKIRILGLRIN